MYKFFAKLYILTACIFLLNLQALSANFDLNNLNLLENQLYNHSFSNENIEKRLSRLESTIFARTYNESVEKRLIRLASFANNSNNSIENKTLNQANNNINQNIKTEPEYQTYTDNDEETQYMCQDNSVTNYPAITEIENRTFNQTFINENIYSRLLRLESKIFGTTFPDNNLADRMEKLQSAVKIPANARMSQQFSYNNYNDYNQPVYNYDNLPNSMYPQPNTFFEDNTANMGTDFGLFDVIRNIAAPIIEGFLYPNGRAYNPAYNSYSPLNNYNYGYGSYSPGNYYDKTIQGTSGMGVRILP